MICIGCGTCHTPCEDSQAQVLAPCATCLKQRYHPVKRHQYQRSSYSVISFDITQIFNFFTSSAVKPSSAFAYAWLLPVGALLVLEPPDAPPPSVASAAEYSGAEAASAGASAAVRGSRAMRAEIAPRIAAQVRDEDDVVVKCGTSYQGAFCHRLSAILCNNLLAGSLASGRPPTPV